MVKFIEVISAVDGDYFTLNIDAIETIQRDTKITCRIFLKDNNGSFTLSHTYDELCDLLQSKSLLARLRKGVKNE